MPAASAAGVMIWGSLIAVRLQQCLLSVLLAAVLYLLVRFLSNSKIQFNKAMLLVLTVEFLLIQGIFWSWRLTGGWGMTQDISAEEVNFINIYNWRGKTSGYYQYRRVENTASLTKEEKKILVAAQQQTERRYRSQGLKSASGMVAIRYRLVDQNIELYIPYYSDIMEILLAELQEHDVQLFSYINIDYPGWEKAFYLQDININLF